MAACILRSSIADTSATPNNSSPFTPVLNDLLVVLVLITDTVSADPVVTSSVGLTFTIVNVAEFNLGISRLYTLVANALALNVSSQTVTVNPSDPGTGDIIFVYAITGMSRTGSSAIRQVAEQNNQVAGIPSSTFNDPVLTDNPTIGFVAYASNAGALTPPTGWTEPALGDRLYNNPATSGECCHRDSGFTGTTITWGSATNANFGSTIVEFDASIPLSDSPFFTTLGATYQ